jgi:hypothetical protein
VCLVQHAHLAAAVALDAQEPRRERAVGAFALVYPGLASIGGLWLGFNMGCAVVVCLAVLHTNPAPAIILALLNVLIVYLRRDQLASLAGTLLGRC